MTTTPRQHHIRVDRTARYATLGDGRDARDIWFVCHGYRQLAAKFVTYFAGLDDGTRLIVAPEGLSRFYVDDAGGEHVSGERIGASWMTREDRETEISDYVDYLDCLASTVLAGRDPERVRVTMLGFSQGAATACRWASRGSTRPDHIVLWAGMLPDDVDIESKLSRFRSATVVLVAGSEDEFASSERIERTRERLRSAGIAHEFVPFEGGHQMHQHVLRSVAELQARLSAEG